MCIQIVLYLFRNKSNDDWVEKTILREKELSDELIEVERIVRDVKVLELTTQMRKHLVCESTDFIFTQIEMSELSEATEQIFSSVWHHRLDQVATKVQVS